MIPPVAHLPVLGVTLDGRALAGPVAALLLEVRLQQRLCLPDQCELTFTNEQPAALDALAARLGKALQLQSSSETLFSGEITAVAYEYSAHRGDVLRIRAYSWLHRLQKRAACRVFTAVDLAGLARGIAGDLPVSVNVPDTGVTWEYIPQAGESDLQLLTRYARSCGYFFTCAGDELRFFTLSPSGEPHSLCLGENLHQAAIEVNGRTVRDRVVTQGWNASTGRVHRGEATVARAPRTGEAGVAPGDLGAETSLHLSAAGIENDSAAAAFAQAQADEHALAEILVEGTAEGDILITPGQTVSIEGVAPSLCGNYVVTEALHRISTEEGYLVDFSNRVPPPAVRAEAQVAQLAQVTDIDDPEALGRVKVAYLTLEDMPSAWLQVLSAGAGNSKGMLMLPDVGDLVVVLCADGLAHALVLGGVFGSDKPKDAGVSKGRRHRVSFGTSHGHRLEFDDESPRAVFQDGAGNQLEFTPTAVRLRAAANLEISAPGKRIRLSARQIDFHQA